MYAVIRTGGKQYRVAPGDVIRIESQGGGSDGKVEFSDVLAISPEAGQIARPESNARVVGKVLEQGRADKILVFHYKRKKQYKKIAGHRQPFTAVRITEIAFDGQKFTAPEIAQKEFKPKKTKPEAVEPEAVELEAAEREAPKPEQKAAAKAPAKKKAAAPKKSAAKKSKSTGKKK